MGCCACLKKIDIYGEEFEFNYDREERYQTKVGGFLSFLAYCFIIYVFFKLASEVGDSEKPKINSGVQFSKEMPRMDLYNNTIFPVIGFSNGDGPVKSRDFYKYFFIMGMVMKANYESLSKLSELKVDILQEFHYVECNKISDPQKEKLYSDSQHVREFGEIYGLCPNITKPEEYYIEGDKLKPPFVQYSIIVFPCGDFRDNYANCAPNEELLQGQITIVFPEFNFIAEDKMNPLKVNPTLKQSEQIHPGIIKYKEIFLMETEIYNDDRDIAKESLVKNYLEVNRFKNYYTGRPGGPKVYCNHQEKNGCSPYLHITIFSSNKKVIYKRTYPKILGTLSEFGGVEEIILVTISSLYILYTNFFYKKDLKKKIFGKNYEKNIEDILNIRGKDGENITSRVIEDSKDGVALFKNINIIRILSDIYLQDHDKILIPLILLNQKQREIDIEEEEKNEEEDVKSIIEKYSNAIQYNSELEKTIRLNFIGALPGLKKPFPGNSSNTHLSGLDNSSSQLLSRRVKTMKVNKKL